MSQIEKIVNVLSRNDKTPGLTASMIAKMAGVPRPNVSKRIHDLRNQGFEIYTNYRNVNGARKAYYRMAD